MATIYIDDKPYQVDSNQNLLHACLSLGFNLEYFCWHPALGSVGACRQCAVKQFRTPKDKRGRLVMACMTPATEGTRISIYHPEAVAFRAGVIEGMMQNHPHDCPVCDEGGECHLQDMTVMSGHNYRRYSFPKRTFRNQYLGPFVNHEMNRCIQCYRCVRFYREYAGGKDLNVFGIRNLTYFGRYEDGVLESEFSGNLDEVCPTGVFTDATHKRHYARKWDEQFAPSICVHCGLGCNTSPGARYGTLRRIVNRYHGDINGYFLCDRGRYGYEFVNSERRIRHAQVRLNGALQSVSRAQASEYLGKLLTSGSSVIGIGSTRASLEANFALRKAVGADHFFAGIADDQLQLLNLVVDILRSCPAPVASLHDIENSDAVFIIGEDLTNSAPRMALSARQSVRQQPMAAVDKLHIPRWLDHAAREAVQNEKGPLFIASMAATRLDDAACGTYRAAPGDIARVAFGVANALDASAPAVPGLPPEIAKLAERISTAMGGAQHPLVISGLSCRSESVIHAAADVARALCHIGRPAKLALTVPDCNSLGLALLGCRPLGEAFSAVHNHQAETVVILENDLYAHAPASVVDGFLSGPQHLIVLDHLQNATSMKAEMIIPVGTYAETSGTMINNEGRAQRFFQVFVPEGDVQESWRWLRDGLQAAERQRFADWENLDDVLATIATDLPELAQVVHAAAPATLRIAGEKIPREPHRYSGRTAIHANVNISEPRPPGDADSPLSFSMEGYSNQPPSALIPFAWSPGWNSYQAWNKFQQEVAGPLRGGNPGVSLIERNTQRVAEYFRAVPTEFHQRDDEWLIVPLYHIFGSEELSVRSPGIKELSPKPYLALSEQDSIRLELQTGDGVEFTVGDTSYRTTLQVRPDLPQGIAGIPAGIEPFYGLPLPVWSKLVRVL